jgi:hypothetical protein
MSDENILQLRNQTRTDFALIESKHAEPGTSCCGYLLPQQERFYSTYFGWVAGYILARKLDRVTLSEIKRAYHDVDERRVGAAMRRLWECGWVGVPQHDRTKRSTTWHVNPRVQDVRWAMLM